MNPTSGEHACLSSCALVNLLTNQCTKQLYPEAASIRIAINATANWVTLTVRQTHVLCPVPGPPGVGGACVPVKPVVLAINGELAFVWVRLHATEAKVKLANAGLSARTSGRPGPHAPSRVALATGLVSVPGLSVRQRETVQSNASGAAGAG